MAVQLNNAPSAQDYTQVPAPQTSSQPNQSHQSARTEQSGAERRAAPDGRPPADARAERPGDFKSVMDALRKTTSELSQKTEKTAGASGEPADAGAEAAETAPDLSALVNPLVKGAEQLRELIASMRTALTDAAAAQGAATKASRFNPDLILGENYIDGSLGKQLQDLLSGGAEPDAGPKAESAAPEATGALLDAMAAAAAAKVGAKAEAEADPIVSEAETTDGPAQAAEPAAVLPGGAAGLADALPAAEGADGEAAEVPADSAKPAALADGLFAAARDAKADRGSKKLAALADELLNLLSLSDPAFAEQIKEIRDSAKGGLSARELDEANAKLEEILAKLGEEEANPIAAYDRMKEEQDLGMGRNSHTSERADRAAAARAQQRSAQGANAWDLDRERSAPRADSQRDAVPSFAAALGGAAEEAFEVRPAAGSALGQAGVAYALDPSDPFGDGITKMLQFLRDDEVSEARIVVEPPALGRIDVSVQATGAGVEAIFKVDNEHLKQMLQQQLDSLKNSLQAQGIHVSGLTVDIKNRDDQRKQDAQEAGKKVRRLGAAGDASGEDGEDAGARLVRLDLEKGLLHWVA